MVTLEGLELKTGRSCLNISTYGKLVISNKISETFSCYGDGCNISVEATPDKILILTAFVVTFWGFNF